MAPAFAEKDKSFNLGANQMMVAVGDSGDVKQFGEWVEKNVQLYKHRHGYEMPPQQAAHFTRREIAESLRRVSDGPGANHPCRIRTCARC